MSLITARTDRITVKLKELSIRSLIRMAAMPADAEHQLTTIMLESAIDSVESGPEDPADWTVAERIYVKCQYMAATLESGPDFIVSSSEKTPSKLSDYLQGERDYKAPFVDVGMFDDQKLIVRHLTGRLAESIERVLGAIDDLGDLGKWEVGMMAAQLVEAEGFTEPSTESMLDQLILERINRLLDMDTLSFLKAYQLWRIGFEKLQHLVYLSASVNDGLVCLGTGGKAGTVPPARFPVDTIIPDFTYRMAGKPAPVSA